MINFLKSEFVKSSVDCASLPYDGRPSILFVGRSNVGKSTLINGLLGQKIAFASKKAGKTKLLNVFKVDDSFFLIDAPGYGSTGYATMSTIGFAKMMEDAVKEKGISAFLILLDLRRELGEDDKRFIKYLLDSGKPLMAVLTKCDCMNQKELSLAKKRALEVGIEDYYLSDLSPKGIAAVRGGIAKVLGK